PRLDGDRIEYAANAKELDVLALEPVAPAAWAAVHTTGRLAWNEDRTARVFPPVGGRVSRELARLEQPVQAGTPLAQLESSDFGQAQADANRAATDLAAAERTLARSEQLFEHGAAPRKDLDAALADRERAAVESERAKRRLQLLGGRLGQVDQRYILKSPVAGVVVDRAVNPGLEVRTDSQTPLFTISDPRHLWVYLDLAEKDIAHVRPGMVFTLTTSAYPGRTFSGTVDVVGSSLDPATRTVRARGSVANPGLLLKAEMYVDIDLSDPGSRPGVAVPSAAVVSAGDRRYVFVEERKGRFRRQPVTPGPERSGRTEILSGLRPGERVVVEGGLLLQSVLDSRG
ncbi:MAG TPA: efflux RND transporter periplasmic adaptor subunit, partial [Thermoanaerobaculia bacterium]|nr:efflux RND transporter periplasmic adaptor subunit [Thermoanaerobaculia bacterium]